jgi:hypothetical protein
VSAFSSKPIRWINFAWFTADGWSNFIVCSRLIMPIYTAKLSPKIVACNLLTTWVVLFCKSSTQLTYLIG